MTDDNYIHGWELYKVVGIELKIDTQTFIRTILPFCKQDMLTSEIYEFLAKYLNCDCGQIIKYNQDGLKRFLIKVLDFEAYTVKQIKDIIEIALNKSIIFDL